MTRLIYFFISVSVIVSLGSCCGSADDSPVDNTVILYVFNLDKSDNLLDDEGPIIFEKIHLRPVDASLEFNFSHYASSGEIAFFPLITSEEAEGLRRNEFILELDSLSLPLSLRYELEEVKCAGTSAKIKSYTFDGQRVDFDVALRANSLDLLADL